MATLVENYICQHFDHIYEEICKGTRGQAAWRMRTDSNGHKYFVYWSLSASKSSVLEGIRQFLHLCLNAGKVGDEYKKIEQWTRDLMIIACMPADSDITDSYKYSKLVEASDPITKFLFNCFDWRITDQNPLNSHGESYLQQFDSRIWYYKQCASRNGNYQFTANLLYDLKDPRNQEVHSATEEFYTEHHKCMQRLIYSLYDYITVFYMITHVCVEDSEKQILFLDEVRQKTMMPDDLLSINIVVRCIDEVSGTEIAGRESDLRVYYLSSSSDKEAVNAVPDHPGMFKVTYFKKYQICIVSDGIESLPSEELLIDYDFTDGIIVNVNIPPEGTPKPEKISVRELVFNSEDLPTDVRWILSSLEGYADNCEYAEVARQLIMASVTKNQFSKKTYQEAIEKLEESLKQKVKEGLPGNLNDYIQAEMKMFQERLSEPFKHYRGKEDFFDLLEQIDKFYEEGVNLIQSEYDEESTEPEQILTNVQKFLSGEGVSIGTSSTEKVAKAHKILARLEFILSMNDKYPEIIEAEFGQEILQNINQLYVDQINYYRGDVIPLWTSVDKLYHFIQDHTDKRNQDEIRVFEYIRLLNDFLKDQPDNVLRKILCGNDILLYWLNKCTSNDAQINELKKECEKQLNFLRDKGDFQLPMICVRNEDYAILQDLFLRFKTYIEELKERVGLMVSHDGRKDILSEVRFDSLCQIISHCSPMSFLQFVCYSPHTKYQFQWLLVCDSLGLNLYESIREDTDGRLCGSMSDTAYEWEKRNRTILANCEKVIDEMWEKFGGHFEQKKSINQGVINDIAALRIVEHQIIQIKKNYADNIPDYILDIINASQKVLRNHAKAKFLQTILKPGKCHTENLLNIVECVLDYWYYSYSESRHFLLSKYLTGDYGKRLLSIEAQEDFTKMQPSSQKRYIVFLMNQEHTMAASAGTRFMMAYKLNYLSEKAGIIPQRDFFKYLTQFHLACIDHFDFDSFVDSWNVIKLVSQYMDMHPKDKEIHDMGNLQKAHFSQVCNDYFDKHLDIHPIEEGKWTKLGILHKMYLHKELRGKNPNEQTIIRYLDLYNGLGYDLNLPNRYKSGWCEVEKELFDEIVSYMSEMSPKDQQETCEKLWRHIFSKYRMPYDDIIAEHLIALKPYFNQKEFDKILNDFYRDCVYGKLTIGNPSAYDGLNTIRTLFEQYGQNVKVLFDGQSTAFVDILISIYQMK